jgi:YegS/Rv2252/BmrU family lipid kinase
MAAQPRPPLTEAGRAVLVVNARARAGDASADEARALLEEEGLALAAAHVTRDPDQLREILREEVRRGATRVVVGGGDGSISAAAGVLAGTPAALAVLPLGTANDFARSIGVPSDLAAACAVAARGSVRHVDVGCAGDRPFINAASVGLSTRVTRRLTRDLKRHAGPFAYPIAAATEVGDPRPFHARLVVDGVAHELDAVQVVIGSGRYHGGGRLLAPDASMDDRRLQAWAIRATSPADEAPSAIERLRHVLRLARIGLLLGRGKHVELPEILHWTAREVSLETDPPLEIDADGELAGSTPVLFRLSPSRLKVIAGREEADLVRAPTELVDGQRAEA